MQFILWFCGYKSNLLVVLAEKSEKVRELPTNRFEVETPSEGVLWLEILVEVKFIQIEPFN